jgi:hypothetical protein
MTGLRSVRPSTATAGYSKASAPRVGWRISAEQARDHFDRLAMLVPHDMPARGERTRKRLGWLPAGPALIADLERLRISDG